MMRSIPCAVSIWLLLPLLSTATRNTIGGTANIQDPGSFGKVTVDIFVMSRCPDALHCEDVLDEVLAQASSIAEVHPNYIGDTHESVVTCKHGPLECAGAKQQLCFFQKAPDQWWQFLRCQDASAPEIGSLPLAERCLAASGLDDDVRESIRACFSGAEGEAALKKSAEATAAKGVTRSCTVFLDGVKRCIYDGGKAYDCEGGDKPGDLMLSICEAYYAKTSLWPSACGRHTARDVRDAAL